jgi:Fe2+ or Zn2+ uptake regulation protein
MISIEAKHFLEIIEMELNSPEMQVLKATIKAAGGLSKKTTFEKIFQHLHTKRKDSFSKAWVYKCLSNLEESGFIIVVSIGNPKQYMVTEESITKALEIKKLRRIDNLQREKQASVIHQQRMESINLPKLAAYLTKYLSKSLEIDSSTIIEGKDNIKKAIATEICAFAKPNDIIRTTSYLHLIESGSSGPAEEVVLRTVFDGVKVLGLIIPSIPIENGMNYMGQFFEKLGKPLIKAISTGNLIVKIANEKLFTYRMISLNSERMILHLTNTVGCGAAALIHRNDNARLIDDAVKTFDKFWNESSEITELMTSLFAKV